MSSIYGSKLPELGVAVQGGSAEAAREAFVDAMSRASIVVAVVAALGAVIAWRYLPTRSGAAAEGAARRLSSPAHEANP